MGRPPHPLKDEAVAWMVAEGQGYRAAAKKFGVSETTTRNWYTRAMEAGEMDDRPPLIQGARGEDKRLPPEEEPEAEESGADLSALTERDLYGQLLRDLGQTIRDAKRRGHGSVVAQCVRQILSVQEAQRLESERRNTDEPLTREEYLAELETAVAGWPEDAFDVVFRVYGELRRCRVLRVMEGAEEAG